MKNFRLPRCQRAGVEAVEADTDLAFGRHTHEQFGIGLIERGAQKSASGRGMVEAGAGDLITVNPGEVHDGAPIGDGGRAWRILYLDPAIVAEGAADIGIEGRMAMTGEFIQPAVSDRRLAQLFRDLYQAMTSSAADHEILQADQTLLLLLDALLQPSMPAQPRAPAAGIALARTWIDDDPAAPLTLAALAKEAGLSRYQFLRGFARETGLTPHAYLMQRRIHRARRLIAGGARLSDAAAASGFSDQSHMTRLFVRSFGMAPGVLAKAIG